jgi:hypothetical protein
MHLLILERLEACVNFRQQNPINKSDNGNQARETSPCLQPSSILFYRDSVSKSQFAHHIECEVTAIRNTFRALATRHNQLTTHLKLTFIVVGKTPTHPLLPPRQPRPAQRAQTITSNQVSQSRTHYVPQVQFLPPRPMLHLLTQCAQHITMFTSTKWALGR